MALNKLFQGILDQAIKAVPKTAKAGRYERELADFIARARMKDPSFYQGKSQKELKELFEKLTKDEGNTLYRSDYFPTTKFSRKKQMQDYGESMTETGEPTGIYWANRGQDLAPLIEGTWAPPTNVHGVVEPDRYLKYAQQGAVLPSARRKVFSEEEWAKLDKVPWKKLTNQLRKDYDVIDVPDLAVKREQLHRFSDVMELLTAEDYTPALRQTIQLNPKSVVTKYKPSVDSQEDIYKILGLGGLTAGAAEALSPEEAEASPLKKAVPGLWKRFLDAMKSEGPVGKEMSKIGQIKPAFSSSHERLKGMELSGSTITGVYQGGKNVRYIHLKDGRILPTDRASLSQLAAERGTQQKIAEFAGHETQDQRVAQAMKSLAMNESKGISPHLGGTKPTRQHVLENWFTDRAQMLGADKLADQAFVRSTKTRAWFMMPKVYAEILEPMGLIKIDKKWTPYPKGKK
jgi:hypothetical protein